MPAEEMRKLQLGNLKKTVKWVYDKVPFYRNKFDELGLKPEDLKELEDLSKLPFTARTDLRDNYPFGLCAVALAEVIRIHASSAPREAHYRTLHPKRPRPVDRVYGPESLCCGGSF